WVDLSRPPCNKGESRAARDRGAEGRDVASILLIDDDTDLTGFLRAELEARGHAVRCLDRAEDGPDLLLGTPFHLVLLDNKMPGMTGIEFLEALRERGVAVPVVMMTGASTSETAIQATK